MPPTSAAPATSMSSTSTSGSSAERLLHGDPETLDYIPPWTTRPAAASFRRARGANLAQRPTGTSRARRASRPTARGLDLLPYLPEIGKVVNLRDDELVRGAGADAGLGRGGLPRPPPDEAYDRLWEAIAHVCRLDADDPAAAWRERMATVKQGATAMTDRHFDAIHLHGPGTDLTVGPVRRRRSGMPPSSRPSTAWSTSRTSRVRRRSRRPTRCGSTGM